MHTRDYSNKSIAFLFTLYNYSFKKSPSGEIHQLFSNCLLTLTNQLKLYKFKKVDFHVADFGSNDCNSIKEHVEENILISAGVFIHEIEGRFGRGPGFNHILNNTDISQYDCVVFIDADMLFTREVGLNMAFNYSLTHKKPFFPVDNRIMGDSSTNRSKTGYGFAFVPTSFIIKNKTRFIKRYDWGNEDSDFHDKLKKHTKIMRNHTPGIFTCWHPPNK